MARNYIGELKTALWQIIDLINRMLQLELVEAVCVKYMKIRESTSALV